MITFNTLIAANVANLQDTMLILLQTAFYDLTGCLRNCTNQGECKLDPITQKLYCECNPYFMGSSCEYNVDPCAKWPCLNNGTCTPTLNDTSSSIKCQCTKSYYGINCENKINMCTNQTCSFNGYCISNGTVNQCICFTYYYGFNCENETAFVRVIQMVQIISLIIFLVFTVTFVTLIIVNDVLNLIGIKNKTHVDLKAWKQRLKIKADDK